MTEFDKYCNEQKKRGMNWDECKTFPIDVLLSAYGSHMLIAGDRFGSIQECISWGIGFDLWTHELANPAVWFDFKQHCDRALPELFGLAYRPWSPVDAGGKLKASTLPADELLEDIESYLSPWRMQYPDGVSLPKGSQERKQSPIDSIPKDKLVYVVVKEES
jgi:hypothetical protein